MRKEFWLLPACMITVLIMTAVWGCSKKDPLNYGIQINNCIKNKNKTSGTRRFILSSSDNSFNIQKTPFQKIISSVQRGDDKQITIVTSDKLIYNFKPQQHSFTSTRFINSDDEKIQEIAFTLSKKFKNKNLQIKAVEKFVFNYITHKKTGLSFIPASMILKGKTGDCTEHGVLAIAILYALKIPSYAHIGLVLKKDNLKKGCGYLVFHMWINAWDGKKWVILDASLPGYSDEASRYIALGRHSLKTEMPLSYLRAIAAIKNLRVVLE